MKLFLSLLLFGSILLWFPGITGCANMVPPTGGPRDSLPPVLISADPDEGALHFNSRKIVLSFDEYIDLKDVRKNLIVSPVPKGQPSVEYKLKTITILIKDTLQPNTTYSLDFGRAVVDNHEGNVLKNFTYVFSTGNYIDSIRLSGRVIMANTGKPDSSLIVLLHDKLDDSAVVKEKPRYIARLDSSGNYTFNHIKPGTYALYALKDESGFHTYTSKAQIFAFADSPVALTINKVAPDLFAYSDTSGEKRAKKPLLNPPPAKPRKEDKEKLKRLSVSGNIPNGLLDLHDQFEFRFTVPIKYFDSSKVRLTVDSFTNISHYHFAEDSLHKKVTLFYQWTPDTKYHLILEKDFAEDTLGEKLLKTDTISFATKKETDYGTLLLRFRNLNLGLHPVLLFYQNDKLIISYVFGKSIRYSNKLFDPGDYDLRILYDDNQNGVWDPGNFFEHRQPEKVVPIKRKLSVKSSWDNEVDITL
ncbi:MAG: Ig-like domain-containing domain [Bacteroidota bacterium]|nr:Ig-like domain-containing domain [Bacteroidota bacterium]MDP4251054.1 Ig-like domain-containing domain [Bacteroidota bacterium]